MIDPSCSLIRSKSDNVTTKSLVWSPTPIRRQQFEFLDELNNWQKFENMTFDRLENPFVIRKIQSHGLLGLERISLEEDPKLKADGCQLFATADQGVDSSSYSTLEIPARASNPNTRDAKFCEASNAEENDTLPLKPLETQPKASVREDCAVFFD